MARQSKDPIADAAAKVAARRLPDLRGVSFTSIDPGTAYYGWALWSLDGFLCKCDYEPSINPVHMYDPGIGIVEQPVVYPNSPVPPQDIAALAFSAGRILGNYETQYAVEPRQWKGTTDGTAFLRRIERAINRLSIRERLTVTETLSRLPKTKHEHVLDAIGLGLVVRGIKV
jgi:hypothetical protein